MTAKRFYTHDEIILARMEANNAATQDMAESLLRVSALLRDACQCEPFSVQKAAALIESLAYETDKRKTIWSWNIKEHLGDDLAKDPVLLENMRRMAEHATKDRKRVVKESKWREVLGFDPGDLPTEEALKQAFKHKAKETHPDVSDCTQDEFSEVTESYQDAKEELFGKSKAPQETVEQAARPNTLEDKIGKCPQCGKPKP